MELLKLKGRIEKAIQSHPYEYDPLNDMFGLCREYEKVDFDIAHAWNHDLRPKIAVALQAAVERGDFLAAERFNDLLYRSFLFGAPHFFDDYLQTVEYGKALDKQFYKPRRHYLKRYVDAYQEVLDGTTGVAPTMTTPGNSATDAVDSGMEQATSSVQQTSAAVDQAVQKTSFLKRVLGGIGGVFSKGFSLGTGALHKLGNAITKVKTTAQKAKTAMSKLKSMLGSALAAKVKQTTSGLGQMFSSLKRIAMYRLIRAFLSALTQALKEGINNLYQYSNAMGGTFAQSMDRLATSASYLKNSLGAMAAPIINALAPAIDFVIDKIATLVNYINMLFARLSGASVFTAAKKSATSYGDALSSAGGSAASAAKEIRDATTGIDELNMIMQKDNSGGGGGGGGGGADYGSMFEELPIDNSVSEFADKLKAAFEAADWKGLGTTLWLIAKNLLGNGNRWPEIANLNGIKGTIIYAGQKLKIPD